MRKEIEGFPGYWADESGVIYGRRFGKPLKPALCVNGYHRVSLRRDGKTTNHSVHRVIAMLFVPNPEGKRTVNHKNGIKTDNRASNLEWATHSENAIHSWEHGLSSSEHLQGSRNYHAKLTEQDVREIRAMEGSGREIGQVFGVSSGMVNLIKSGKNWKHVQ